jgi:xanthosine utilization system XapX-like protein
VIVATLAAAGIFSAGGGLGTRAVAVAVAAPVLAGLIAFTTSRPVRGLTLGVPLAVLVAIHAGRVLGVLFLLLHSAGRLPPTFALTAGWGDILVAAAAGPLAWAIRRRVAGWWPLALAWNSVGVLDLVMAVSLGLGSAPDTPVRFVFEHPDTAVIGTLPWILIPGFLVPIYLLAHFAIFAQLASRGASEARVPPRIAGAIAARRGRRMEVSSLTGATWIREQA